MTGQPDTDHLEWAIDQRAKVQHTLLALYIYVSETPPDEAWSAKEEVIDALIAAAFSLWRAVFLAEEPRTDSSRRNAQRNFLSTVVSTNAITFGDDKRASAWTVGYYMSTASNRIFSAAGVLDNMNNNFATKEAVRQMRWSNSAEPIHTRREWEGIHTALRMLFNLMNPDAPLSVEPPIDTDEPI
ncbi:MAG: hypothetical protein Q8M19_14215 [Reyranella sp.]|nr:hypothetical protein [Reyranella sp.]